MADPEVIVRSPEEILRAEAEAAEQLDRMVAESRQNLSQRCPDCGALGSLEEHGGELRCIDCDVAVGAVTRLAGFGRR